MLTLTKEEAVKRHRELWNKIAELCTGGFSNLPFFTAFSVFDIKGMALNALGIMIIAIIRLIGVGRANMRCIMQYTFIELTKVYAASAP